MAKKETHSRYVKLAGGDKALLLLKVFIDKVNMDALYTNQKGERFIMINVNQGRYEKGEVFLSQSVPKDKIDMNKSHIIGVGQKTIDMDYWIEELQGGSYLDYLFENLHDE